MCSPIATFISVASHRLCSHGNVKGTGLQVRNGQKPAQRVTFVVHRNLADCLQAVTPGCSVCFGGSHGKPEGCTTRVRLRQLLTRCDRAMAMTSRGFRSKVDCRWMR